MSEWKEIELTQGYKAIVDVDDFERVNQFKWFALKERTTDIVYARRNINLPDGRRSNIGLHRFIMNAPKGMEVDHWNGDGLDNRKENLRILVHADNMKNSNAWRHKKHSKFKGVKKLNNKYQSRITCNHITYHLGTFDDELDAALAYDEAARKHHGIFASLNFPEFNEKSATPTIIIVKGKSYDFNRTCNL